MQNLHSTTCISCNMKFIPAQLNSILNSSLPRKMKCNEIRSKTSVLPMYVDLWIKSKLFSDYSTTGFVLTDERLAQFIMSAFKKFDINQDVMSSPDSNSLFIEDQEELNLGLLDDSEEEEQVSTKVSKLSDLVNSDNTRKRRPILSGARVGGDPRLSNSRKTR